MLKIEIISVKFAYDKDTNMYLYAYVTSSKPLSKVIGLLSRGDTLLANSELFNRESCYKALVKGIDVYIMHKKNARRIPELKGNTKFFKN